jgi:hypothetical protein
MIGDVKAGQTFYYSANIEGRPDLQPVLGIGGVDWNAVAGRVANGLSSFASGRVVGSGDSNITLAVTSLMDRASQDDLKGNIDATVASQPEINRLLASMIRLTDASINPVSPAAGLQISPAMWAVIGIGLFLLLKR